ncbi:MAG: DUF1549 and DUF1553 domain-containing protein [Planctomycetaceae bacterium]
MSSWIFAGQLILTALGNDVSTAQDVAGNIDRRLSERWQANAVVAAPLADDAEFLRRVSLDLIGRIPTSQEVRSFLHDADPEKRARIIDRLLADPQHAEHFARVWRALLLPEANSDRQIQYFQPGLEAWLRNCRQEQLGFDEIVRRLLTVPIAGTETSPQLVLKDLRGPNPIAFIASKEADPAKLAASTTRLFLGVRLECAQCHDHPFDSWTQHQFWNQAAFFAGIERRGKGPFAPVLEVADRRTIAVMDKPTTVPALYLDGSTPTFAENDLARKSLAEWITSPENPYFATAIVNRIWGELMGRGIVEPVDDFHAGNPPSHPELLAELAGAFKGSHYDLLFLYRSICLSEAYQRTSHQTDESQRENFLFARKIVKPMSGEQFFDSLVLAISYPYIDHSKQNARPYDPEKDGVRRKFLDLFSTLEQSGDPETSVLQALTLMNGELINEAVGTESGRVLQELSNDSAQTTAQRIDELYLRTFSRNPTDDEQLKLIAYIEKSGTAEHSQRLGDIFWMLLNSAEFRWNH